MSLWPAGRHKARPDFATDNHKNSRGCVHKPGNHMNNVGSSEAFRPDPHEMIGVLREMCDSQPR